MGAVDFCADGQFMMVGLRGRKLRERMGALGNDKNFSARISRWQHDKSANVIGCIYPKRFIGQGHARDCMIKSQAKQRIVSLPKTWDKDQMSVNVKRVQHCVEKVGLVFAIAELIFENICRSARAKRA